MEAETGEAMEEDGVVSYFQKDLEVLDQTFHATYPPAFCFWLASWGFIPIMANNSATVVEPTTALCTYSHKVSYSGAPSPPFSHRLLGASCEEPFGNKAIQNSLVFELSGQAIKSSRC